MAPHSRIFLTRHAQAEHNVDLDYSIPDAPLTALGKKQAISLAPQISKLQQQADLIVSSPLKRTLQTTKLGWAPAISRLGGLSQVILLPQAQECNDFPCDTGSPKEVLSSDPELSGFDFTPLDATPDWTSKRGFWAPDTRAISARARWVRRFLYERPEENIVLVAHGDILRAIMGERDGSSVYAWKNAECRIYQFASSGDDVADDCYLLREVDDGAAAGGYALTSTDADLVHEPNEPNGKP